MTPEHVASILQRLEHSTEWVDYVAEALASVEEFDGARKSWEQRQKLQSQYEARALELWCGATTLEDACKQARDEVFGSK